MSRPPSPPQLAKNTARWAVTMARWAIRYATNGNHATSKRVTQWQLVSFLGPNGGESRGIVDVLAIRKNHRPSSNVFARGDLFDMVLIQVKGGTAKRPCDSDLHRLRAVQEYYRATAVVLVEWKRGYGPKFSKLVTRSATAPHHAWAPVSAEDVFCDAG